jgi:hypothetical protein
MNKNIPTEEEIKIKLEKLIKNSGFRKKSQHAHCIEFGLLQGIAMCAGDDFPPYYFLIMASGRSILD